MSQEEIVTWLLPGDPATRTGGYVYDRRIVEGLRAAGWRVEVQSAGEGYPFPGGDTRSRVQALAVQWPDGRLVVADGLAFGALPDLAQEQAHRLRWVALVHHPLALENGLSAAQCQLLHEQERRALAASRHVVVTSAHTAGTLVADYGMPPPRISVVEPGTDPAPLARGSGPGSAGLVLLCVATVTPRKAHAVLVEALAGLRDRRWTLHCVGSLTRSPDTTRALRAAIQAHGLQDRVRLHGEVDDATLHSLYDGADLFVLPSLHEGYGMVLAEALARGIPVLATQAGAIADTVPAGAGVLVPPGDAPALREALAALLDDPHRRAALAAGARAARSHLPDWPSACARFAAILRAQLGGQALGP